MTAERIKTLLPRAATAVGPLADLVEGSGIEPVDALLAIGFHGDHPRFPQQSQVAGDGRLAYGEEVDELIDAAVPLGQGLHDPDSSVVGQSCERLHCDQNITEPLCESRP